MDSVVGMGKGVAMVTGTVVGAGIDNGVWAGGACVIAGAFVPELVVQPEESTHSRITRVSIRILIRFISSSLILIPISDLWMVVFVLEKQAIWYGDKEFVDCAMDLIMDLKKGVVNYREHLYGHCLIWGMWTQLREPPINIRTCWYRTSHNDHPVCICVVETG